MTRPENLSNKRRTAMPYVVVTSHGSYEKFDLFEEAQQCSWSIMNGYLEGLTCANDPQPTIIQVVEIEKLVYDKVKKIICRRVGVR